MGREKHDLPMYQKDKIKTKAKTLFVSATPSQYELDLSGTVAEQIIRPTGLLDPRTYVYPKSGDYDFLMKSLADLLKKKPHLATYMTAFDTKKVDLKEVFDNILPPDGI